MGIIRNSMGSGGAPGGTSAILKQAHQMASMDARMDRLTLICEALWTLLQEQTHLTEDDLARRIVELDLRDGKLDGKYVKPAVVCSSCGSTVSTQFGRCLFCGKDHASNSPFEGL